MKTTMMYENNIGREKPIKIHTKSVVVKNTKKQMAWKIISYSLEQQKKVHTLSLEQKYTFFRTKNTLSLEQKYIFF